MPPEIVDLNDYQVADWPSTPEGEARQADEVVRHYRTLLSHPAVAAITWWDFADGGWLNAPSGLVRRRRHAASPPTTRCSALIKGDWWLPPTTLRTAADGTVRFDGFLGEYAVSAAGRSAVVRLDQPGACRLEAVLER